MSQNFGDSEDEVEVLAKRLYPYIKSQIHSDDELTVLGNKLYPKIEENFHRDIGNSVVNEAAGVLRKALWTLGGFLLAFVTGKWSGLIK